MFFKLLNSSEIDRLQLIMHRGAPTKSFIPSFYTCNKEGLGTITYFELVQDLLQPPPRIFLTSVQTSFLGVGARYHVVVVNEEITLERETKVRVSHGNNR